MKPKFTIVDFGCFMFETKEARWIIEHPRNGYKETQSKMWDAIVEHPITPHSMPLKFIGSYSSRQEAINQILQIIIRGNNYDTFIGVENKFYKQDYTTKDDN